MKIGSLRNYVVEVYPTGEGEAPEQADLYTGMFTVVLNFSFRVRFVPAVDHHRPPWPADQEPPADDFTTPAEVRWYELITSAYSVTPSVALAGRVEHTDSARTMFYVSPEQFAAFTRELTDLAELTGGPGNSPHRDELMDRSVVRFIDEQVLGSPYLNPAYASLGRRSQDTDEAR